MTNSEVRYKSFMDRSMKALIDGDIDTFTSLWSEDCIHQSIDPFDQGEIVQGREAMRAYAGAWSGVVDFQVLKNKILSADSEGSIGNARVKWTADDGTQWACDYIYQITLDSNALCTSYKEWNVVRSAEKN